MELTELLSTVEPSPERPVVFLTGAGFSVASGIPTFRGPEGYWTVGSEVYHPQDLATHAAFSRMPRDVWHWYLYRKGICGQATPNRAHRALAELEQQLGDAFLLVTQNVDGLHRRGGSSAERLCEVHGNIDLMRDVVTGERLPIPDDLALTDKAAPLTDAMWERLVNPATGHRCRPHVLWFDEYYREDWYRSDTAMRVASQASALVVVGSSGAASLPMHATAAAAQAGAVVVDVNPDPSNPFAVFARSYPRGAVVTQGAVEGVWAVAEGLAQRLG